jgi:uncharacterized protein YktB (UPF0637 family)
MTFSGFTSEDFQIFTIAGLEPRMEALIHSVRPKLHELGQTIAPYLSAVCGEEMTAHVAKHARRSVNPPDDTWVAWANNKRGYKAHPHFQIGLWSTHVFIQFAIIYESQNKAIFADNMMKKISAVRKAIPDHYFWSLDHMQPEVRLHSSLKKADFEHMLTRLREIKMSEILCGLRIERDDPLLLDGPGFIHKAEETFASLMPLYRMGF